MRIGDSSFSSAWWFAWLCSCASLLEDEDVVVSLVVGCVGVGSEVDMIIMLNQESWISLLWWI